MNLRTNTAIMLINALRLRRRDPRLRLALRRLAKKHTPNKIANIYAKFSSIVKGSPEKDQNRIVDEFRSGIRQDFLFLLIGLFKRVDIADKRLEEIKQDLDLVLKKLREDLKNVKKTTTAISTLLRNEPQLKTHPKFLQIQQDIEKIEFTFERILQSDFKNTEALKKKLQEVVNEEDLIVNQMYQKSLRLAA